MKPGYANAKTAALVALFSFLAAAASAHIKNEATQFPDIEFSDARFDIVVLVGAGIIPETPVFEPDKILSRAELASWAALTEGLLRGGETPDVAALSGAALEHGLVGSLEGDASLAELNRVFFDGQLDVDDAERAPSKAEAATIIAAALGSDAGRTLLSKRGLEPGATGDITAVTITEGHHGNAYVIAIDDTALQMDEHGRVANGPTDLLQWEGRSVRRSFVRGSGDHARWIYLEAEPRQPAGTAAKDAPEATAPAAIPAPPDAAAADRSLLYWLTGAVAILALVLFFRRRKSD